MYLSHATKALLTEMEIELNREKEEDGYISLMLSHDILLFIINFLSGSFSFLCAIPIKPFDFSRTERERETQSHLE